MNDISFKDCEYRKLDKDDELYCENKLYNPNAKSIVCDNCKENVHLNCKNYVAKNDMCLLYFELGVSEVSQYDECQEKRLFSDKDLSRGWSN